MFLIFVSYNWNMTKQTNLLKVMNECRRHIYQIVLILNSINQFDCYVLSTVAPDRISKVLSSNANCGPCHADHHGHLVVHLEHPVVNIDLIKGHILQ